MDPRVDATEYLEKHDVKRLFRDLGTGLVYKRPADPNAYLLELLQDMQTSGTQQSFFTEDDVRACFAAFDPNQTGFVTAQQYKHALSSLGVDKPTPLPADVKKVECDKFIALVMDELQADAR